MVVPDTHDSVHSHNCDYCSFFHSRQGSLQLTQGWKTKGKEPSFQKLQTSCKLLTYCIFNFASVKEKKKEKGKKNTELCYCELLTQFAINGSLISYRE